MSHLTNHQSRYPVGLKVGRRTVIENGIHKDGNYYVRVRCDCRSETVVRPRDLRETCHSCKKLAEGEVSAQEFKKRFLGNPRGKLVPVDVIRNEKDTNYSVVFYCQCRPRLKYVMPYQRWYTRVHQHCYLCAALEDKYIPASKRYIKGKTK